MKFFKCENGERLNLEEIILYTPGRHFNEDQDTYMIVLMVNGAIRNFKGAEAKKLFQILEEYVIA
jgi:hypothetical protein